MGAVPMLPRAFASAAFASAAFVFAGLLALPCFGDEPTKGKPAPASGSLDEERGPLGTSTPPTAAPAGWSTALQSPGTPAPNKATPPQGTAAAPQGSSPQGTGTPGASAPPGYSPPPGNYPPPGYGPRPAGSPPGYGPRPVGSPPGYSPYPPPVYGPYIVDGAKESDYLGGKKRRRHREPSGPPDPLRKEKRTSKIMVAAGLGGFGLGWVMSVVHGAIGELVGVECHYSSGGWNLFPSCSDTDDYRSIYIPVVGPIIEASNHKGTLSELDDGLLAIETVLQIGGLSTALVGGVLWPSSPTTASLPVTFTVTPTVSARSTGLAVVGTF